MRNNSSKDSRQESQRRRVWIFVADAGNKQDLSDLDHLDAILWGANPNTRLGDLVLMYRTAPYSDIAYVFTAASDARPAKRADRADTKYVIQLSDKVRLIHPVKLQQIRATPALSKWSLARTVQGVMRRRRDLIDENVWPALQQLIIRRNEYVASILKAVASPKTGAAKKARKRVARKPRQRMLKVFLSYGSPDLDKVERLYRRLRRVAWLNVWFNKDTDDLMTGDQWQNIVPRQIEKSDAMIICLSSRTINRRGFLQSEIGRALFVQEQQPEGTSFISPITFDQCDMPPRLSKWHCTDLRIKKSGIVKSDYRKLIAALERRADFLAETS